MILNHELTRINTNWADGLPSVASHSNEYSLSQIHQKFIAEPRTPNSEPRKYNLLPYIIQKSRLTAEDPMEIKKKMQKERKYSSKPGFAPFFVFE